MKIKFDRRPLRTQYAELTRMEKIMAWALIPAIIQAAALWAFIITIL